MVIFAGELVFISFYWFLKSGASMGQKCLQNSAVKSLGPGDLLFGMSLREAENSSSVIGESSVDQD